MRRAAGLFDRRVTRLLVATGGFAVATGFLGLVQGPSANFAWLLIVVGLALVAVSAAGLSESDAAGRIWSVSSFRVRPSASRIADLPITPRVPRGVSPPRR